MVNLHAISMIEIHPDFRPLIKEEYPSGNKPIFEEWFFENFDASIKTEREYLPVFWTSFYVNHRYGQDLGAVNMLQRMLDNLDRSKKYYTILQYDDGIKNNIDRLDIKVFGSGGGRIDYPLPLLCQPHTYQSYSEKVIFASFRGNINNPIRKQLKTTLKYPKYRFTEDRLNTPDYLQELSQSTFALCPRGYGLTSFRICEALQQGTIPVYISDKFIIPHNTDFQDYGVLIGSNDIPILDSILSGISDEEIKRKQYLGKIAWRNIFSWHETRRLIFENAD